MAPLLLFTLITIAWLWPVLRHIGLVVPGAGAGDNLAFVWNAWWMHQVLSGGGSFFRTSLLFAPVGVDLALNTHTALPSAAAALLFPGSPVAGTNLLIAVHLFLNFASAYALAWRVTRSGAAAILAALVFGWSPYVGAHLPGHLNLIAVWVLPLTALLALMTLEQDGRLRPVALGITLGALVYIDYYYTVYAIVLLAVLVLQRSARVQATGRTRGRREVTALTCVAVLFAIDLVIIVVIASGGGRVVWLAWFAISMRSADNPLTFAGLLVAVALAILLVTTLRIRLAAGSLVTDLRRIALPALLGIVVGAPVLLAAVRMCNAGDYVTQKYFWRSAPSGVDATTLLLGNPTGLLWGQLPANTYKHFGIDGVEQVAWLGPAVLALCVAGLTLRRRDIHVRLWTTVSLVFLTWALGPYLVAFGYGLHLMLPATLVRFIPIVANARIPARAMVGVYLAASIIAAIGFTALRERGHTTLALVLCCGAVLDLVPARPPLFETDRPAVYEVLRRQADSGAVCELPMGIRDGFGERGRFDSRVLLYQTIHQRPMTGGFVARLPPRIVAAYERDPVLGTLLRLSEGKPLAAEHPPSAADAGALLRTSGIRYVVVNRIRSARDLLEYVRTGLPLRLLAEDTERSLYALLDPPTSAPRPSQQRSPSRP